MENWWEGRNVLMGQLTVKGAKEEKRGGSVEKGEVIPSARCISYLDRTKAMFNCFAFPSAVSNSATISSLHFALSLVSQSNKRALRNERTIPHQWEERFLCFFSLLLQRFMLKFSNPSLNFNFWKDRTRKAHVTKLHNIMKPCNHVNIYRESKTIGDNWR